MRSVIKIILDAIFPPKCLACGSYASEKNEKIGALCAQCRKNIPINTAFFCSVCKKRNPENKRSCHPSAQFILGATSFYENNELRELIHAWKYKNATVAAKEIETLTEAYIDKIAYLIPSGHHLIIPVPLHKQKEKSRGFNQSVVIAYFLRKSLEMRGISAEVVNALVRIRKTKSQAELKSKREREENLSSAFRINKNADITGKQIILVDDVFTSGATMNEAAKILKGAGAKKILGFVIALA